MKLLTSLILLLSSIHTAAACESLFTQPLKELNKEGANQHLNQTLLQNNVLSSSADNLSNIDCYLSNSISSNKKHAELLSRIQAPLKKLANQFQSSNSVEQKRQLVNSINRQIVRDAGTGFIIFPGLNEELVQINLFYTFVDQVCQQTTSRQCAKSTELAQNLWAIAGIYRGLGDQLNQDDKQSSLAFNQALDSQWRSYKDDTIKLWPQEVLLNSIVYRPSNKGLSSPPNYKLLGLRPNIGLSYLSDQSHRIQPTLNIDLLGVYWWQYDQENKATPGRGLSATLLWDGNDTAYGFSYHHNPKWSFTVARGDENDLVLSMSFQLAHWLLKK